MSDIKVLKCESEIPVPGCGRVTPHGLTASTVMRHGIGRVAALGVDRAHADKNSCLECQACQSHRDAYVRQRTLLTEQPRTVGHSGNVCRVSTREHAEHCNTALWLAAVVVLHGGEPYTRMAQLNAHQICSYCRTSTLRVHRGRSDFEAGQRSRHQGHKQALTYAHSREKEPRNGPEYRRRCTPP
jgi:hypothetical protein